VTPELPETPFEISRQLWRPQDHLIYYIGINGSFLFVVPLLSSTDGGGRTGGDSTPLAR
jgi:hypothetical protein